MKYLFAFQKTPDHNGSKIAFTDNNTNLLLTAHGSSTLRMNGMHRKGHWIERADAFHGDPFNCRWCCGYRSSAKLALGGDEAIRVNADSHDSFLYCGQIAAIAKDGGYDLVFTVKPSTTMVHPLAVWWITGYAVCLAGYKIYTEGTAAVIDREIEGGEETCKISLPAVVSCQKGMAEQRIPIWKALWVPEANHWKWWNPAAVDTCPTSMVSFDLPRQKRVLNW